MFCAIRANFCGAKMKEVKGELQTRLRLFTESVYSAIPFIVI